MRARADHFTFLRLRDNLSQQLGHDVRTMLDEMLKRKRDVEEILRPLGVRRLEAFGSGATANYDTDIDVLVEFDERSLCCIEEKFSC